MTPMTLELMREMLSVLSWHDVETQMIVLGSAYYTLINHRLEVI